MMQPHTRPSALHDSATPDAEILKQLANGDINALGELYDRYQGSLRRFVGRVTDDGADVDDIVHATFLTAAKSAAKYDGRASCRPWLMGIAVQLLRRRRRAVARWLSVLVSFGEGRSPAIDPRPGLHARTDMQRALGRISEAKRTALVMAEVEGLSCAEIADALGIPMGTVWTRLHAARRELRALLEGPQL